MSLRCTCGAYPPEDARFCHKCGRPLYESELTEDEPVIEAVAAAPVLPPPIPSVREAAITFRNKTAVVVSVLSAALTVFIAFILFQAVPSGALVPILFCGGGFLAATMYTRASGERLSPQSGARMGFMTCFWGFLAMSAIVAVFFAAFSQPSVRALVHEQLRQMQPAQSSQMEQGLKLMENPGAFITELFASFVLSFFMLTLFSMLGGIIGARLSNRSPMSR